MKCFKCGKEMDREDGNMTLRGICVDVTLQEGVEAEEGLVITGNLRTPENIAYNNLQLGKYSDGKGECHVAICYECYIDGMFNLVGGADISKVAKDLFNLQQSKKDAK